MNSLITLLECFFCYGQNPVGRVADGDCKLGFSFGVHEHTLGSSNGVIADLMVNCLNSLPIIAQFEIAGQIHPCDRNKIFFIGQKRDDYLPSWVVMDKMIKQMNELNLSRPIVFAHPAHIWRIKKHFAKKGIKVIIPDNLHKIPYDNHSVQWWTCGPIRWWPREIPARLYCWHKNLI